MESFDLNDFDDYWTLLSTKDCDVYFEIRNYLESPYPSGESSVSQIFRASTYAFLESNLINFPYPTCQIVRFLPSSVSSRLFYDVLQEYAKDANLVITNKNNFFSLLANISLTDKWLTKCEKTIFPVIFQRLTDDNAEALEKFPLILLVNQWTSLIECFRHFRAEQNERNPFVPNAQFTFAIEKKVHFLENIFYGKYQTKLPAAIGDCINLVKIIMTISNSTQKIRENFVNIQRDFFESISVHRLSESHAFVYEEISRIFRLYDFMRARKSTDGDTGLMTVRDFSMRCTIVDFLYEYDNGSIIVSSFNYKDIRELMMMNRKSNERIFGAAVGERTKTSEIHLLDQFYVTTTLAELILLSSKSRNYNDIVHKKCHEIQVILDAIDDEFAFVEAIETMLTTMFVRWEHVTGRTTSECSARSGFVTTTHDETDTSFDDEQNHVTRRWSSLISHESKNGFICSLAVLKHTLDILDQMITKRSESLSSDRLKCLDQEIKDAKWRLSLYELHSEAAKNRLPLSKDVKQLLTPQYEDIQMHAIVSSSDDDVEDKPKATTLPRRKPRRRNPFRRSDPTAKPKFSHSTEIDCVPVKIRSSDAGRESRLIISRMLAPPTSLVATCMSRIDLTEARRIVQMFKLESSSAGQELRFIDHFDELKQQLRIFLMAKPKADNKMDVDYSVEEIKNLVVHGFEASQILNHLEQFIVKNPIVESHDTKALIDRFVDNYPYLKLYTGNPLQATTVTDYMLNVTGDADSCFNIFNMVPKLWDNEIEIERFVNQIGYFGTFKKIVSCLSLFSASSPEENIVNESPITVQRMLATKCNSFNADEVQLNLKQQQAYLKLQSIDAKSVSTVAKLKEHIQQFDIFNKRDGNLLSLIFFYAINMNRLTNFQSSCEFREFDSIALQEILEVDLFAMIGDIIFDNNQTISLADIEAIVCNLNTNLLHVISRNTCPYISIQAKSKTDVEKQLQKIVNFFENGNENALKMSAETTVNLNRFEVKRNDILEYVAKHNRLMAFLMGEIHQLKSDESKTTKTELNAIFLENLKMMKETKMRLENIEQHNMTCALRFDIFDVDVLEKLISEQEISRALDFLLWCQEKQFKYFQSKIERIQDLLIERILEAPVSDESPTRFIQIENICDLQLRTRILLDNIESIDDHELVSRLTRTILLHSRQEGNVSEEQRCQLHRYLAHVELYAAIAELMENDEVDADVDDERASWTHVMRMSRQTPEIVFSELFRRQAYDLCHRWLQIHSLNSQIVIKPTFVDRLLRTIASPSTDSSDGFVSVCKMLLKTMVTLMGSTLLSKVKNRELLEYLIDFLIDQSQQENQVYRNYKISLRIMDAVSEDEASSLFDLIDSPLLIVEQYILNTKFENLSRILQEIRSLLVNRDCEICRQSSPIDVKLHHSNSLSSAQRLHHASKAHNVSTRCIDRLLRIYAAKSLDFRISDACSSSTSEAPSQTTDSGSLDSLCGTFVMPREAPDKINWTRDEEAAYCMCCKRSVFTMLTRRHHCRRCGRVICHSCSTHRLTIPKLYADVLVRVCDDCFKQTDERKSAAKFVKAIEGTSNQSPTVTLPELNENDATKIDQTTWIYRFSGHGKHDNLLREEFSFEYAPSASLCLSILSLHTPGIECAEFLLNYCQKFEALLRPLHPGHLNPEIDYAFVTRILYCLSLAAKVHGNNDKCTKIREHAEIINAVVTCGCESLLPMETISESSLRKLCDSLVVAEKWSLAIDLSLKCGFPKTGIMAAWGVACLKSGCFETAREKFSYCLTRSTTDEDRKIVLELLTLNESSLKQSSRHYAFSSTSRPTKVQPILHEIISVLEATCHPLHADALHKSSLITQSNRSLASLRFRRKDNIPIHEPAVNIMHTLANLRQITQGKYVIKTNKMSSSSTSAENGNSSSPIVEHEPFGSMTSRFYTESLFYLISYGRHVDILRFLIKHRQVIKALKYSLSMRIPSDQFIQHVILPHLKNGRLSIIVENMIEMDETLIIWRDYIMKTCLLLEKRNLLNSLYQVQLFLKDTVRASMTCVKFYTMGCSNYRELQANVMHLHNASEHLKSELELYQWEEIKINNVTRRDSTVSDDHVSLVMKMDPKSLNQHINTIWMQIEASKFLGKCENDGKETIKIIPKISLVPCTKIPTLFGTAQDKIILTSLILICGTNIEEGFGLAYRIIQELNLNADKIYAIVTKFIAMNGRLNDVEKLIDCIKGNTNQPDTQLCDEILSLAVQTALNAHSSHGQLPVKLSVETLIRAIDNIALQIDCYILAGQLKSAYLLAVQHKRMPEIRRILRHADKNNQPQIKKLCEKKLMALESVDNNIMK